MNELSSVAQDVTPNPAAIRSFLEMVRPSGPVLLVRIDPAGSAEVTGKSFMMPGDAQAACAWAVAQNQARFNVYWTVNLTSPNYVGKCSKRDMTHAVKLWADIDPDVFGHGGYAPARAHLLEVLLPALREHATTIIDSGHGLQAFFDLDAPMDLSGQGLAEFEALNARLGRLFAGPGTHNCDRVMRLAGTVNYPGNSKVQKGYPGTPAMSRVLGHSGAQYSVEQIKDLVGRLDLQSRFSEFLNRNSLARERWNGRRDDLQDSSGSGMDMSMVDLMRLNGFNAHEVKTLLMSWQHGSENGRAQGDRYWQRMFDRCYAAQAPEAVDISTLLARISRPKTELNPEWIPDFPFGVVGQAAEWINATSRKPQPLFALQASLAFCSTVMGRRFVTSWRNWPSLFLLNIGKSGCGKEHAKFAVESALEACGMSHLIGPAFYTSDSGVLSALLAQPSHFCCVDEFGKVLESASVKHSARVMSALRQIMEVWARCDGVSRPQGYSTFGLSDQDAQKLTERTVRNPALTLLAMTTPESFFEAVGSAAARDGFLNRFLIMESPIGRQAGRVPDNVVFPADVRAWAEECHRMAVGNLGQVVAESASVAPEPRLMGFSPQAEKLFRAFESDLLRLADDAEQHGMAEMYSRTAEIAMRVSMIVARGAGAMTISGESAQWAIEYVGQSSRRFVERLIGSVYDSEFEAAKKQVRAALVRAADRGMAVSDIDRACRRFRCLDKRGQINVLESLAHVGQAAPAKKVGANGREYLIWVAVSDSQEAPE